MTPEKDSLLKKVQMYCFLCLDAGLYLNSHPTCSNGIEYFNKCKKLKDEAIKEYEAKCGPLTALSSSPTDRWTWIDEPWPWERGDN